MSDSLESALKHFLGDMLIQVLYLSPNYGDSINLLEQIRFIDKFIKNNFKIDTFLLNLYKTIKIDKFTPLFFVDLLGILNPRSHIHRL